MVSGTIVLFLLSVVICLVVGYFEGARVGAPVAGLAPVDAARAQIGVKLYYASFAVAAVAWMADCLAALVCAIGGEVSPAVRDAMPVMLVGALVLLAVTSGTLVWTRWPRRR